MGNRRRLGNQPEIPGKSVTDLLAQVLLRMAGPGEDRASYDDSEEIDPDQPYPPNW